MSHSLGVFGRPAHSWIILGVMENSKVSLNERKINERKILLIGICLGDQNGPRYY